MRRTQFICSLAILAGLAAAAARADDAPGLTVGDSAPAFKLKDQLGQERTLAEFLQDGNVAIVFHRSASW